MPKCEFSKLHLGMGVLLYKNLLHIYFQNTFSEEHLWMAASDTGYLAHFLVAFEMESIYMSWKLNERQNIFIKIFMTSLEKGCWGRNKQSYYILPLNKSNYEWPLKRKWKNHGQALMQAVFQVGDHFWARGNWHSKGSCTLLHCFYILRNLKRSYIVCTPIPFLQGD